jgi:hypothetical protein
MKMVWKLLTSALLAATCTSVFAQKRGQSVQIQYGKVVAAT